MENNKKLSILEKLSYGAGDLACNLFWGIVCIAGMFYSDIFGLTPGDAAFMMMIIGYLDIVIDIFIGGASDRCNTKYGKFRPWILYGMIPFCVAGIFAFMTPDFSMAGRKDKKVGGYFFAGFGPVDVYTNMVATNIKSFATAGFTDYKAHVAGNANVPGSIMEKEDDLKAADEMAACLIG